MAKEVRRVELTPETDVRAVVEQVHSDKIPRLIERAGEALAVVVDPEDYDGTAAQSDPETRKEALLSYAGIWKDLDTDSLIDYIYRARHAAPPSPPVELGVISLTPIG